MVINVMPGVYKAYQKEKVIDKGPNSEVNDLMQVWLF